MSSTFSSRDFKLGLRMLARHRGLTLVSVLGMSVGITIAAAAFTIVSQMMNPSLPFPDGDRIVSVGLWHNRTNNQESRVLHEFASWRDELRSIADVGAARMVTRNLIAGRTQPEPVSVAEISASAFRVTGVMPALGRALRDEDERAGASEVVVIGDDVWRRRFGSDPGVLGAELQLGNTRHTIVGVMPKGFRFPVAHSYWVPLRIAPSYEPLSGPGVLVFGRLSPGATLESARAEVDARGQPVSTASPATHEHLRARVFPYTHVFTNMDDPDGARALRAIETAIVLLLIVVCVNVAILVYARTATRQGEIAVRSALGASRRRIVTQWFTEALVLASVAALVALVVLAIGFRYLQASFEQLALGFPFWLRFELSPAAALYVVAFTLTAAAIVGVVPALKATGRHIQGGLQGLSAGGGSRMQMGRLWTLLIVVQVAIAVAILPATVYYAWTSLSFGSTAAAGPIGQFLSANLVVDRPSDIAPSPDADRAFRHAYATTQAEIARRVASQGNVAAVTFSAVQPGGELAGIIEADSAALPGREINYNIVEGLKFGHLVRFNRVDLGYFEAFDVPLLMGRELRAEDTGLGTAAVIVDRTFVDRIFSGENPLGRRFRYVGRSREAGESNMVLERWHEVVGVVESFPPHQAAGEPQTPRVYHAAAPGEVYPAWFAVRVRTGAPQMFGDRLRDIAAAVDPALQLRNLSSAQEAMQRERGLMRLVGATLVAVMAAVVGLAAAGIYALMSLTVSRRRKEIGIRTALGADPRRVLMGIFSRAFAQLAGGAALGIAGAIALGGLLEGEMFESQGTIILPAVALLMTLVGLLAALGPARRGLQIQPTEALRED